MIEFTEFRRNPVAPTFFVNKIAGIYRLSDSIIKTSYALAAPGAGGIVETMETISLLWPEAALHEAQHNLDWALKEMRRGTFMIEDGVRFIRAH